MARPGPFGSHPCSSAALQARPPREGAASSGERSWRSGVNECSAHGEQGEQEQPLMPGTEGLWRVVEHGRALGRGGDVMWRRVAQCQGCSRQLLITGNWEITHGDPSACLCPSR